MSNRLEIEAVTTTLRHLIQSGVQSIPGLDDTDVTVLPPDAARGTLASNQVNIFLYQIAVLAPVPVGSSPRPLALQLSYLLTAYGREDDHLFEHRLLASAMSVLYDHPLLTAGDLQDALPDTPINAQVNAVRIAWQPMSTDELSRLWTAFRAPYRVSAAYQIAPVQIDPHIAL